MRGFRKTHNIITCSFCGAKVRSLATHQTYCTISCRSKAAYARVSSDPVFKSKNRVYRKRYREQLNDALIKRILKDQGIVKPSDETVEEKRLQLQLKRALYEKQREIKSQRSNGKLINVF
jgi:hypothetical protein